MLLLLFLLILLLATAWGLADYQLNARIDSATPPAPSTPPAVIRAVKPTAPTADAPVVTPGSAEDAAEPLPPATAGEPATLKGD
jgi:hypothetical protein